MRGHCRQNLDNREWTNSTIYNQNVKCLRECFNRVHKIGVDNGQKFSNLYDDIKCLKLLSEVDKFFDEENTDISGSNLNSLVIFAYALKRNQIVSRLLSNELFKKEYLSKKSPYPKAKGYDDVDVVIEDNTNYYHDVKARELFNILLDLDGEKDDVILNDEKLIIELARQFKMDRDSLMDYVEERELGDSDGSVLFINLDHFNGKTEVIGFDDELTVARRFAKLHEEYTKGLTLLAESPFKKGSWLSGPELQSITEEAKRKVCRTYHGTMILEMTSILSGKFLHDQYHLGCEWIEVGREETFHGKKFRLELSLI